MTRLLPALLSLVLMLSVSLPLAAQSTEDAPAPDKAVETLLQILKDDAARAALVEKLEAAQSESGDKPAGGVVSGIASLLSVVSTTAERFGQQVTQSANLLIRLPDMTINMFNELGREDNQSFWLSLLTMIGAVLVAALAAEWIVVRLLARPLRAMEAKEGEQTLFRIIYVIGRLLLKLPPVLAFAGAAFGVLSLFNPEPVPRLLLLTVINSNLFVRIGTVIGQTILSPRVNNLRLIPFTDETANYLYIWVRRFLITIFYGYFFAEAALLLGLPEGAYNLLLKLLGLLVLAMTVAFILQNREPVAVTLKGESTGASAILRSRLAGSWHIFGILYAIAGYLVWALEIPDGFAFIARATAVTLVILVAAKLLRGGLRRLTTRLFRLNDETRARYPMLEARANRYLPAIDRIGAAIIAALALIPILQVWGVDVFGWLGSEAGQGFAGSLASIVLTVTIALLVWEVVSIGIERYLKAKSEEAGGGSQRLLTLLPLIRNFVRIALAVFAALIVLSELGINIAPLLAGAGVVGLAIGFGAQTLVKDVITGVFMLMENSIAVNDWVRISDQFGRIESMSIRTVRIRDLDGQVHTIPFGEITMVTNLSREFGVAMMDIGVAYREDYDEVVEILSEIGREIYDEDEWKAQIITPLEVMGLQNLADSAVEIRVKFQTKPMMQWKVRREFLKRVKKAFDARGIEIPFPHQTIYFGVDKDGTAPPANFRPLPDTSESST